jgi:GNAT superfamily N-acetyltransferase
MNLPRSYAIQNRSGLNQVIDSVCSDCRFMLTRKFEPTPDWNHALELPDCDHHLLLVAQNQDQIIGWCRLFPVPIPQAGKVFELGLGVLSTYRRQGVGSALMDATIQWARESAARAIVLSTHFQNGPAIHLFVKKGFLPTKKQSEWVNMKLPLF